VLAVFLFGVVLSKPAGAVPPLGTCDFSETISGAQAGVILQTHVKFSGGWDDSSNAPAELNLDCTGGYVFTVFGAPGVSMPESPADFCRSLGAHGLADAVVGTRQIPDISVNYLSFGVSPASSFFPVPQPTNVTRAPVQERVGGQVALDGLTVGPSSIHPYAGAGTSMVSGALAHLNFGTGGATVRGDAQITTNSDGSGSFRLVGPDVYGGAGDTATDTLSLTWTCEATGEGATTAPAVPNATSEPAPRTVEKPGTGSTDLPEIILVLVGGLVVLGGGGLTLVRRRKQGAEPAGQQPAHPPPIEPVPPIEPRPDAPPPVAPPPPQYGPPPPVAQRKSGCTCTGHIAIKGRNPLRVPSCFSITWDVFPWRPEEGSPYANADPRVNQVVIGRFSDGEDFCRRRYEMRLVPTCSHGATVSLTGPATWRLVTLPSALRIECSAPVVVRCPGERDRRETWTGVEVVPLIDEACRYSFLINEDHLWKLDAGHTSVRFRCGEYDFITGYRATTDPFSAIVGVQSRGGVDSFHACYDDRRTNEFGWDLSGFYADKKVRQYTTEVSCATALALRGGWQQLAKNPGMWDLYSNNCTTIAWQITFDYLPPVTTALMETLLIDDAVMAPFTLAAALGQTQGSGFVARDYWPSRPQRYLVDLADPFDNEIPKGPAPSQPK
jgi:hypothetical protein